jgi:hypothetical protein
LLAADCALPHARERGSCEVDAPEDRAIVADATAQADNANADVIVSLSLPRQRRRQLRVRTRAAAAVQSAVHVTELLLVQPEPQLKSQRSALR